MTALVFVGGLAVLLIPAILFQLALVEAAMEVSGDVR